MDATSMIVETHTSVERAFARYDHAEGSHHQQYLALRAISDALAAHAAVEDELLYPALRQRTGRYDAEIERQLEHAHLLDLVVIELGAMVPSDPRFDAKVRLLLELFRQHAREQERVLVPELRRRLDSGERERLGDELAARVGQLARGVAA
jgi:hemerythrin-like domain-containing protein